MTAVSKVLRRLVAAYTVLIALVACLQFIDIYRDAWRPEMLSDYGTPIEKVYTPEKLSRILGTVLKTAAGYPVLVIAAMIFGGQDKKREAASLEPEYLLTRAKKRADDIPEEVRREEAVRKRLRIIRLVINIACGAGSLAYLLNKNNFASWDLEPVMGSMLRHVVPWLALGFCASCVCSHLEGRSAERERRALHGGTGNSPAGEAKGSRAGIVRWALLIAAAAFIIVGAMNGDPTSVMAKAIRICTECIGLG